MFLQWQAWEAPIRNMHATICCYADRGQSIGSLAAHCVGRVGCLQEACSCSLEKKPIFAQAARNYHAMLAARVLGRLAGLLQGALASAPCPAAREALSALLTPALASQLANPDPKPLLMHLNSSLLNPQARPAAPAYSLPSLWSFLNVTRSPGIFLSFQVLLLLLLESRSKRKSARRLFEEISKTSIALDR